MIKRIKYLILVFVLFLFSCDDKPMYPVKTYENTIFRLKEENDSLREQLEKCDNWVNFLESQDSIKVE